VAAVNALPGYQHQGFARQVVTSVAAFILQSGRCAVCTTDAANQAMSATALSVGFRIIPPEQVWWIYPSLPDF
jgi:predicted GNAT family acetyltransferase